MSRMKVVYDGHCRLCAGSVEKMRRWPAADRLDFLPLQDPAAKALLPGKSDAELQGQMHVVEDGVASAGADGWFRLMRVAPLRLRWLAWITPRFVARPVYAWIARNRIRWFGRTCDAGTCAVHSKGSARPPTRDSQDVPPQSPGG
jgi:predicted DCC family thiol-disulfide oxidoreductase YuxK